MTHCPHCRKPIDAASQLIAARGKLSQAEAARVLGIPRQNLNRIERGRSVPRNLAEMIARLRAAN